MAHVQWIEWHGIGRGRAFRNSLNSEGICRLTLRELLSTSSCSTGLSTGQYEFPFKIQILALLTSFKGLCGGIQYSLIASI